MPATLVDGLLPSNHMASNRLSPLDAAFLYYEKPHQRLHVGCVALLDGPLPFEPFVAAMTERVGGIARYRQRPVRPFLDLDWPRWENDPRFDMRRHVRHVAVPAPGDDDALHALIDTLFAIPLDPDHPLWETYVIDGLEGGRSALLCKMHHAMVDGVSGAQLLEVMADPTDGERRGSARTAHGGPSTARSWLPSAAAMLEQGRDVVHAIGTFAALARDRGATLPFNGPIGDARRIVWASFALDDFLAARGAADCKVNDVVLAVVAGALRRWLAARGVTPDGSPVRTLVPVSIRSADEHLTLGNLVTAMIARLPVEVAEPRERLRRVAEEMRGLKDRGEARAWGMAMSAASLLPAPVHALLGRLLPSTTPLNTVTTNVPGPRETCRMLGRRIEEVHPIVPLFDGLGIEFAIMSYADRISICAVADPVLVPDAAMLREHLHAAAAELRDALGLVAPRVDVAAAAGPCVTALMQTNVVTLIAADTLATAWSLMRRHRIRHLPVVGPDAHVIGMVTHRDLLAVSPSSLDPTVARARVALSASVRVADVMESHVSVVGIDELAASAGERMLRHKIGGLPVVDAEGRLAGIVTADDFVRWAAEHMRPESAVRRSA